MLKPEQYCEHAVASRLPDFDAVCTKRWQDRHVEPDGLETMAGKVM